MGRSTSNRPDRRPGPGAGPAVTRDCECDHESDHVRDRHYGLQLPLAPTGLSLDPGAANLILTKQQHSRARRAAGGEPVTPPARASECQGLAPLTSPGIPG